MDLFKTKEILLGVSILLATKGVAVLETDLWAGVGVLGLATGIFILRAYLKKIGWELGNRR